MPRVLALSDGFHEGRRIRKGVEFEVAAGVKGKWFVAIDEPAAKAAKAPKAPKTEPATLAGLAKDAAKVEGDPATAAADLA